MKEMQSDIMFAISLENYTVMAKHGAYDFEHESNQPFNVTIRVEIYKMSNFQELVIFMCMYIGILAILYLIYYVDIYVDFLIYR